MKHFLFTILCIGLISGAAVAQDFPRVEIFGGYSLERLGLKTDEEFNLADESGFIGGMEYYSSNGKAHQFLEKGISGSVTFNANSYFGVEAAVRWNSGDIATMDITFIENDIPTDYDVSIEYSNVALLVGPHFAVRKNEVVTPFAHALIGLDRNTLTLNVAGEGEESSMDLGGEESLNLFSELGLGEPPDFLENRNGLGVALGGGIDVNVHDNVAIRLIQADYYMSRHGEKSWNNIALAFGAVLFIGGD